ncbi:DUF4012 domain-containing protein [Microbacterium sp. NPDC091313]
MAEYPMSASRRLVGRIVLWSLVGVLAIALLGAAWIGVRAVLAYGHLDNARSIAGDAASELADPAAAAGLVDRLSDETAAARSLTGDPVWQAAQGLPWVGPQLSAVATVARTADDVVADAVAPLAQVASAFSLDSLRPVDGRFDLSALTALQEPAAQSAAQMRVAADQLATIDADTLIGPLREPIAQVQTQLEELAEGADALQRATALMPTMLGADGPRNYLVLFQNNAEWRSLGGIPGAMAVIHTEDGRISLTAQANTGDFQGGLGELTPLTADQQQLYGSRPLRFVQSVTQLADFTSGAPLAREIWRNKYGVDVDGVFAVDPVTLSYLLAATGPVTLPTGDVLSEETAVPLLLNEVYQRYERPKDQDAFFAAATAAVFGTLSSGSVDPAKLVEALVRAGDEHRLYVWNADAATQSVLDGTTLQGTLPVTDAETTRFGVYLNDGTGSKMDYYMSAGASVGWCSTETGAVEAQLSVRLRSDAPADAASLPAYITGNGAFGVPEGETATLAYLYLPPGAEVVSASATGTGADPTTGFGGGYDGDRRVLTWSTRLLPGEEATATVRVSVPRTPQLETFLTPGVRPEITAPLTADCGGAGG